MTSTSAAYVHKHALKAEIPVKKALLLFKPLLLCNLYTSAYDNAYTEQALLRDWSVPVPRRHCLNSYLHWRQQDAAYALR